MTADLSAYVTQFDIGGLNIGNIAAQAEGLMPLYYIVRDTWTHETLSDIMRGNVFVSDNMINEAIAKRLTKSPNSPLDEVKLVSEESRLNITAKLKNGDTLELGGKLTEFVHKGDKSYLTYKIDKHKMPGHGIYSWLFANLSLSMVQNIMGELKLPENLPLSLDGSKLTVDLSSVVAQSEFGKAKIGSVFLKDAVEIERATPKAGGIELKTRLNLTEDYKKLLQDIVERVQKRMGR